MQPLSLSSDIDPYELGSLLSDLEALSARVVRLQDCADVLDSRLKWLSIISDKLEARAAASALVLAQLDAKYLH